MLCSLALFNASVTKELEIILKLILRKLIAPLIEGEGCLCPLLIKGKVRHAKVSSSMRFCNVALYLIRK